MPQSFTLSIVMPAHNEAGNLRGAVEHVYLEIKKCGDITDWEIIIVDSVNKDGSSDGTPEIADELARNYVGVKVIHNRDYVNLGFKYSQGLKAARFEYFMMVPGENTLHGDSLANLFGSVGRADIVVGYIANMWRRPFKRRAISRAFVIFMNLVFGLKLRYYNGVTVIKTEALRKLNPNTQDFAYMAEILVLLLKKQKMNYVETPFYIRGRRKYGGTKALEWRNIKSVTKTIFRLFRKVYLN